MAKTTTTRKRRPGAGRPRKPTDVKKLAGTLQPCRTNPAEPKITCQIPEQAFPLGADGKRAWKILVDVLGPQGMRVCTKADVFAMTLFCQAWDGYMSGRRQLQKIGSVYISKQSTKQTKPGKARSAGKHPGGAPVRNKATEKNVTWRVHPLARVVGEERDFVNTMLAKMGLTPADRSRVQELMDDDGRTAEGKVIDIGRRRRTG